MTIVNPGTCAAAAVAVPIGRSYHFSRVIKKTCWAKSEAPAEIAVRVAVAASVIASREANIDRTCAVENPKALAHRGPTAHVLSRFADNLPFRIYLPYLAVPEPIATYVLRTKEPQRENSIRGHSKDWINQ